ncbi:MAG: PGPGW domain-containing protein [Sumerlaeia bacterium]
MTALVFGVAFGLVFVAEYLPRESCAAALSAKSAGYRAWKSSPAPIRKTISFVLGFSTILVGLVMLVTPGPAVVVVPLGLAILAAEFLWAKRLLIWLKTKGLSFFRKDPNTTEPSPKEGAT